MSSEIIRALQEIDQVGAEMRRLESRLTGIRTRLHRVYGIRSVGPDGYKPTQPTEEAES